MSKLKSTMLAASVAMASVAGLSAHASTISMTAFDINEFNTVTNGGVTEDFEGFAGGSWNAETITSVGTFASIGGIGSGSVCNAQSGGNCQSLFVSDQTLSGQGNLVPLNGTRSLSSNDTNGIFWNVFSSGASAFNRIVFAVRDAADLNGTTFTVATGDGTQATLTGQENNNGQLVVINLGGSFTSATVSMFNNRNNDGFTIDGATTLSAVPVPAALPLLLAGVGGLGLMARRKRKAA